MGWLWKTSEWSAFALAVGSGVILIAGLLKRAPADALVGLTFAPVFFAALGALLRHRRKVELFKQQHPGVFEKPPTS